MWFKPTPDQALAKSLTKAQPNSVYGIFLGYKVHPGGKFSGQYIVLPLTAFVDKPFYSDSSVDSWVLPKPCTTDRVEISKAYDITFPLRPFYELANHTLEGTMAKFPNDRYSDAFGVPVERMMTRNDIIRATHKSLKQMVSREEESKIESYAKDGEYLSLIHI